MPKCKGKRIDGKRCRKNISKSIEYCRWHRNCEKCSICDRAFEIYAKPPLECGHWAHKKCILRHTITMQYESILNGTPQKLVGKCPICRREVKSIEVKPIESIYITEVELAKIIRAWFAIGNENLGDILFYHLKLWYPLYDKLYIWRFIDTLLSEIIENI